MIQMVVEKNLNEICLSNGFPRPALGITPHGLLLQGHESGLGNGLDSETEAAGELPHHQRGNGVAPDPAQHFVRMGEKRSDPGDPDQQRVLVRSAPSG